MGFFDRLKTGWALAMDSLAVLRRDPELAAFPLVAGVAGVVYTAALLGGAALLSGANRSVVFYGTLFVLYFGTTFIASFFTAGLMHQTRAAFEGRDPSFRAGIAAAWSRVGTLLAWAALAATVGVLLRIAEKRTEKHVGGSLFAGLFSVAWAVLTYFVVPVIVFEDVGLKEALSRSGETFERTWGETAGAGFGVGAVTFALLFLAVFGGVLVVFAAASTGSVFGTFGAIALWALLVVCAYLVGTTLGSVARTALYVYATEGRKPGGFDDVDFTHAE